MSKNKTLLGAKHEFWNNQLDKALKELDHFGQADVDCVNQLHRNLNEVDSFLRELVLKFNDDRDSRGYRLSVHRHVPHQVILLIESARKAHLGRICFNIVPPNRHFPAGRITWTTNNKVEGELNSGFADQVISIVTTKLIELKPWCGEFEEPQPAKEHQ